MTAFYTGREWRHLEEKSKERGDDLVDLVLCSDGVMRTEREAQLFESPADWQVRRGLHR